MYCFRIHRCGWNRCNCGCGNNNGCSCGNNSGCGRGCGRGRGCRGGNSGCGCGCGCNCGCSDGSSGDGHDICVGARCQVYREGFRNGYWEGFNDVTWGNPGRGGHPTPRTTGGPGPAIAESGCGYNN